MWPRVTDDPASHRRQQVSDRISDVLVDLLRLAVRPVEVSGGKGGAEVGPGSEIELGTATPGYPVLSAATECVPTGDVSAGADGRGSVDRTAGRCGANVGVVVQTSFHDSPPAGRAPH